jgi:hypothetical protein
MSSAQTDGIAISRSDRDLSISGVDPFLDIDFGEAEDVPKDVSPHGLVRV